MRRLILIATVATLAVAKPGLYREKEDFQFSRSSTDEGSKSGFYGAQRGNMGGNYERAHNMDGLAQHQMSGLVKQVQGELGDGSNTRSGSVFTAANSRGVYGSGHYDLSNLEGRNFQEGVSFGDSSSLSHQSHSSLASHSGYNAQSSASNSAAYSNSRRAQSSRVQSGYNGYNGYQSNQYSGQIGAESNLQQTENSNTANQYGHDASGYYLQSAYNGQNAYDQSALNLHSANSLGSNAHHTRLVSAIPVKVVLRPGTRVTVPISAQTYDSANSAAYNHNSISSSNSIDQNSDAELISSQNHQNNYRPTGAKHYESSYSYQKEWEKHDTKPVTVVPVALPTVNPFPKNSELYEDAQSLSTDQQIETTGVGSQSSQSHSRNSYGGYNTNVNSASLRQSQHHTGYNSLHHSLASGSNSAASSQRTYSSGVGLDTTNQVEDVNSTPKSYHSSYSYHKSWERQGDPYVIRPASSGYAAQASQRLTSAMSNLGTWNSQRYGSNYQQSHQNVLNLEDCDCDEHGHIRVARSYNPKQYEEQSAYEQEFLNQQSQNLEDLGQQTQSQWDKLEDVAQQSQSQWDRIEDLGQQTQNKWDKVEDLGQQTQNNFDKIEDLGQQAQNNFGQSEDLGQQTQNSFDKIEDLGQQTQNGFDKIEDFGQQTQNKFDKIEDLGQQTQTQWDKFDEASQQTQSKWDNFGQQSQLDGQQLHNTWGQLESGSHTGIGQETQNNWNKLNTEQQDKSTESLFKNEGTDSHRSLIGTYPIPASEQKPWNENVHENNPFWQQTDIYNNPTPYHNHFNNPMFNVMPYRPQNIDQPASSIFFHPQTHSYNTWNHHESSGSNIQNNWAENHFNHHDISVTRPQDTAQESSSLWNLWNKVDTIEKQTISSNNSSTTELDAGKEKLIPTIQNNSYKPAVLPDEVITLSTSTISPTTKVNKQIPDKKEEPSDVGRGDISSEDSPDSPNSNEFNTKPAFELPIPTSIHKQYNTPTESVTQDIVNEKAIIGKQEKEKNINLEQQNDKMNSNDFVQSTHSIDGQYQNMGQYNGNTATVEIGQTQQAEKFDQENIQQQFEGINQPGNFLQQQNRDILKQDASNGNTLLPNQHTQFPLQTGSHTIPEIPGTNSMPINETETGMTSSQQSETDNSRILSSNNNVYNQQTNAHDDQQLENNDQFSQQHTGQEFESFQQQSNNFDQQNTDQQFESFQQQSNNFDQQNTDQQFESFQQQSNNFNEQNADQEFENFDQQIGKGEMNMEQQFETLNQQQSTFDSHDTEQSFVNLETQNKDTTNNFENVFKPSAVSENQQTQQQFEQFNENYGHQHPAGPVGKVENLGSERVSSYNNIGSPTESFDQSNLGQVEDFGQQVQTAWEPHHDMNEMTNIQETQNLEVIPVNEPVFKSKLIEDKVEKPQITQDKESVTQDTALIDTPVETETQKPGFWKSVGNKFVSAKDKVFSWFGKS